MPVPEPYAVVYVGAVVVELGHAAVTDAAVLAAQGADHSGEQQQKIDEFAGN